MSNVVQTFPGGDFNVLVDLRDAPALFTYHASYRGPIGSDDDDNTLETDEVRQHPVKGGKAYLKVHVPQDRPVGLYQLVRFERRSGRDNDQRPEVIRLSTNRYADVDVKATSRTADVQWTEITLVD
jgi:hypothetical protein